MLFSAFGYFTNTDMKAAFVHLGFPNYFRIELGVLKVLGALVLLIPIVPKKLKDFAYFGFALTFISAIVGHIATGDPLTNIIGPIVFLGILTISYRFSKKHEHANTLKHTHAAA